MIAFACPITDARLYERYAEPGINRAVEPDSEVLAFGSIGSIFRTYNHLLDRAAEHDDLEALVLLHQDAEIMDPDFSAKVRDVLRDPDVALVGCAGAVAVRNISWWEGSVTWASLTTRFDEMGGGELPGLTWHPEDTPSYAHTGEVDTIDGLMMVMSAWAVRNLRFDESLGRLHGYDLDICMQARAAGKKVMTTDVRVVHHHSLDLIGDEDGWVAAHIKVAEKWEDTFGHDAGHDWKQRARQAEAEAEAARLKFAVAQHFINQLAANNEALAKSKSWRWTAPLRGFFNLLRRIRHPRTPLPRDLGETVIKPSAEPIAPSSSS